MLTYGPPAPPAGTILRCMRAVATTTPRYTASRYTASRYTGWSSTWPLRSTTRSSGWSREGGAVPATTRPLHLMPACPSCPPSLSRAISTGQTRLPSAKPFWDRTAADLSRYLSSVPKRPEKGKEAQESAREQASQSDSLAQEQQKQQLKGIRKVLPSLTPHENIYTVPNLLTFSRLVVAPFIGYAILHDAHTLALGLFAYAGVSDLLDGWIARRWKLQTVVGSVVDPMADKALMTILTICLATKGALPVWLACIILGRDVGLGIAAIYYRWISLPPPKTFTRYWDFSLPSAEVRPTTVSKYNTFLQLGLMGAMMVAPVVTVDVGGAMTVFQYLVATTTVWSGLSYVFSKDAVRILTSEKKKKE